MIKKVENVAPPTKSIDNFCADGFPKFFQKFRGVYPLLKNRAKTKRIQGFVNSPPEAADME